jgi:hypothetical protein
MSSKTDLESRIHFLEEELEHAKDLHSKSLTDTRHRLLADVSRTKEEHSEEASRLHSEVTRLSSALSEANLREQKSNSTIAELTSQLR